ncbi:hypothetical protein IV38_GL001661 [Lactobacillus selangorensis]|uniref:Uncharacterized protein n=1 Tax=Lactobacillus selangorensis TaxID=81857 RepID=A0A0R2FWZ7_9LACO|nr:hypothetical protein [Lactobacillus selangorensis]KRN28207.1 hypothetical protein IV38_GL001661 [Lactobacillus selangorensis]KRN30917.1 hypothetical protein IV40_GL001554 [Lactobacillus selangorensis]
MFNYETYLKQVDSLSFEEALDLYNAIYQDLETDNQDLHELWGDTIDAALDYVQMRTKWNFMDMGERMTADSTRTNLHNQFMSCLTIFSRECAQLNLDISWIEKLGPTTQRKRWGDFAGYILCFENLKAR